MSYEAKKALMNVSKQGYDYYLTLEQQIVNEGFFDASNVYLIKAENRVTNTFDEMYARITNAPYQVLKTAWDSDQYRKILFKDLSYTPFIGQIFKIEEHPWITLDTAPFKDIFATCVVKRSNLTLNFMKDNIICSYPSIIENLTLKSLAIDIGVMKEMDGKYQITVAYNDDTKTLSNDMRFIIGNEKGLIITNIDKTTHEGLIYIVCDECQVNPVTDDLYNNIADRWKETTKPSYEFIYNKELTINKDNELDLNLTIKNNGIEIINPILNIISSNENVIKYVNNKLTGVGIGMSTLTIEYQGEDKLYSFDIIVNVIDTAIATHTYNITSLDNTYDVQQYCANIFTCNRLDDSKGVYAEYDISIDYSNNKTNIISIEETLHNSIQIRNNSDVNTSIFVKFIDKETLIETIQEINLISYE